MEGYSRNEEEEGCHQFLDLIPKGNEEWFVRNPQETSRYLAEDKRLELRLGLPDGGMAYFPHSPCVQNPILKQASQAKAHFLHLQSSRQQSVMEEESSQPCRNRIAAAHEEALQISDKKVFPAKTAVPKPNISSAQKSPLCVVGWPPIRSFRKNLASGSSSRLASESTNVVADQRWTQNCKKSLFVKINMDGIPIGRKVDLKAFDSYEKLVYAVDELFRDLAAPSECSADGINGDMSKDMSGGLLNENGEYTLVYEDNEGGRMLVRDVPWLMFMSTVKRLRVLRSSELPTLSYGSKHSPVRTQHTT